MVPTRLSIITCNIWLTERWPAPRRSTSPTRCTPIWATAVCSDW
jgi:hypothetical protein